MKKFKNSRLSTDSRKLQTLALKDTTDEHLYPIEDSKPEMGNEFKEKTRTKNLKITHEPILNRFHHTPKFFLFMHLPYKAFYQGPSEKNWHICST